MSPAQAAEILAAHNKWRRHNSSDDLPALPMVDPLDLGRAIDVAVKALAAQVTQAEPYGWVLPQGTDDSLFRDHRTVQACTGNKWEGWQPVYLAAPVAQAEPLTPEQITRCWGEVEGTRHGYVRFARAIEAAHGIKENP